MGRGFRYSFSLLVFFSRFCFLPIVLFFFLCHIFFYLPYIFCWSQVSKHQWFADKETNPMFLTYGFASASWLQVFFSSFFIFLLPHQDILRASTSTTFKPRVRTTELTAQHGLLHKHSDYRQQTPNYRGPSLHRSNESGSCNERHQFHPPTNAKIQVGVGGSGKVWGGDTAPWRAVGLQKKKLNIKFVAHRRRT